MYARLIEIGQATLAENRRVRADAANTRAHLRVLLLKYRSHRLMLVSGGNDAHTTRTEQQLLAGLRILVVDDHEDSRELLQQAFTFLGAEVSAVATAEDAMSNIASADVVVTDFALKGKDGAWLLAQINTSARPIPVVLLSGFVETQTAGIADASFALKLLKPVDPMELAKHVRAIVGARRRS